MTWRDEYHAMIERIRAERSEREAREAGGLFGEEVPPPPAPVRLPTNGTPTSEAAARRALPRAETDRLRVLTALAEAGSRGLTREELGEVLGIGGDTIRPRVWELMEKRLVWGLYGETLPLVHVVGDERLTRSGRQAAVLRLSAAGIAAVQRLAGEVRRAG